MFVAEVAMNRWCLVFLFLCGCSAATPMSGDDGMLPQPPARADSSAEGGAQPDARTDAEATDAAMPQNDSGAGVDSASSDTGADVAKPDGGGCLTNSDCKNTEYCETGTGNCGGVGVCKPTPGICPLTYVPVCGCDTATYDNDCLAHAGRTSVAFSGKCP